jgi:dTMP kinase
MNTFKQDGFLINLEGTEGCGKTTQARRLCEALRAAGHEVIHVKEPGGTPLAEAIRTVALSDGMADAHVGVEVMLMMAAKIELHQRVIAPAIHSGQIVVCERGWGSLFAYQTAHGAISDHEMESLYTLSHAFLGMDTGPYNRLQILLDQSVEQQRARVAARNTGQDHFERRDDAFFVNVNRSFKRYFQRATEERVSYDTWAVRRVVDVEGADLDSVAAALLHCVNAFIGLYIIGAEAA